MTRFYMPRGYRVRYDWHQHPRGVSAILIRPNGKVRSVGFAKFNPNDGEFKGSLGAQIALGRALSKLPRHLTRRPGSEPFDALS